MVLLWRQGGTSVTGSNVPPSAGIQSSDLTDSAGAISGMTAAAAATPEQYDVALAVGGDSAAFGRLYRAHVNRVTALARWLLGGDDVDDAVQDTFVRAWEKLGTYSGDAAFGTWLHRVAVNVLLRRRQQRSRHRTRHVEEADAMLAVAGPIARPDLKVALETAVGRLPAGAREVFVLHDMEGYQHAEIARMLDIDAGTSRSQLHRARMLLRGMLA
jgi:RNA polymerase sigma-70 factor (ECF subfamily)